MSGPEHLVETRRWLRYAREDLEGAERLLAQATSVPRHICLLAQQAAEKALKAVLIFLQIEYPYTHNLNVLRNLVPEGWTLKENNQDLAALTAWAIEARYPGTWPEATEADARTAVTQARAVWTSVARDLADRGFVIGETP